MLFPQIVPIVQRCLREKVTVDSPGDLKDLFLAPYYGWVVEGLLGTIWPDTSQGKAPEVPRYEADRGQDYELRVARQTTWPHVAPSVKTRVA